MNVPLIVGIAALASSPGAIYGIYHLSHSSVKQEIQEPIVKEEAKPVEAAPILPPAPEKKQSKFTRPSLPPLTTYIPNNRVPSDDILKDLRPGTIGDRYKGFLLGDRTSSLWTGKLETWTKTYKDPVYRGNLTQTFTPRNLKDLTIENLHTKCRRAYEKTSWTQVTNKHQQHQYWAMVSTLCGKGGLSPSGWGGN